MAHALEWVVVPVVFRTPRSLAALNCAAVGLAMAATTSAAFDVFWTNPSANWSFVVGLPTLVIGIFWAALLRRREKVGLIPIGWVLSVPLAAFNAAIACALLLGSRSMQVEGLFGGMFLGATFGMIVWVPALIAVLVLFGLPIARARRLAQSGLAGEERGERFIGLACAVLSAGAIALSRFSVASTFGITAYATMACTFGVAAAVIAQRRENARRTFVARVEADEIPGLRVEARAIGKVIVSAEPNVETYRIAPKPDLELIELDDDGSARRVRCDG